MRAVSAVPVASLLTRESSARCFSVDMESGARCFSVDRQRGASLEASAAAGTLHLDPEECRRLFPLVEDSRTNAMKTCM